jgi:hypothetical protein
VVEIEEADAKLVNIMNRETVFRGSRILPPDKKNLL